jgi:hypothetical protein
MSTLKADTIQSTGGGAATLTKQSAAKAWIHFTAVSSHAIRGSFNVSTLTDVGTGDSQYNFTNNMTNDDYSTSATSSHNIGASEGFISYLTDDQSTSNTNDMRTVNASNSTYDAQSVHSVVHGDLA